MRDLVLEAQKRGEIVSRNLREEEELTTPRLWEENNNIKMPPRRAPWSTIGVTNDDILDSASEQNVPITPKNLSSFFNAQSNKVASGAVTVIYNTTEANPQPTLSVRVCTNVLISGNAIVADFTTIRLAGEVTGTERQTIVQGYVCEDS